MLSTDLFETGKAQDFLFPSLYFIQRFTANTDATTVVKQRLARPTQMWTVRFTALDGVVRLHCMRVEVYGWESDASMGEYEYILHA